MREWSDDELRQTLTIRQYDVLVLVAQHYSSKDIGRQLNLSYRTVDAYIPEILRRLDVPTRSDAGRVFLEAQKPTAAPTVQTTLVAETLDDLPPDPPAGVAPADLDPMEAATVSAPDKGPSLLAEMLKVPPVGGPRHDLTTIERMAMAGRIGLVSIALLAAVVTIIVGVLSLLNR